MQADTKCFRLDIVLDHKVHLYSGGVRGAYDERRQPGPRERHIHHHRGGRGGETKGRARGSHCAGKWVTIFVSIMPSVRLPIHHKSAERRALLEKSLFQGSPNRPVVRHLRPSRSRGLNQIVLPIACNIFGIQDAIRL